MRPSILILAAVLALAWTGALHGEAPELEQGVFIMDKGSPLEVQYCSVPCVVDWNNDGAKDLLVGQFTSGYIWLYLNQGTNLNPLFSGGSLVESNGSPITGSYG